MLPGSILLAVANQKLRNFQAFRVNVLLDWFCFASHCTLVRRHFIRLQQVAICRNLHAFCELHHITHQ